MALKKPITGTTTYLYVYITRLYYKKPTEGMPEPHTVEVNVELRDTADPTLNKFENSTSYNIPVVWDHSTGTAKLVSNPLSLTAKSDLVAQAYVWLKSNTALFGDFISI